MINAGDFIYLKKEVVENNHLPSDKFTVSVIIDPSFPIYKIFDGNNFYNVNDPRDFEAVENKHGQYLLFW